jgi:hypothetical protein
MRVSLQSQWRSARSVGVVDAINAEDIGKFPNTNVAESCSASRAWRSIARTAKRAVTVRASVEQPGHVERSYGTDAEVNVGATATSLAARATVSTSRTSRRKASQVSGLQDRPGYPPGRHRRDHKRQYPPPFDAPGTQACSAPEHYRPASRKRRVTPEISGLFNWTNDDRTLGFSSCLCPTRLVTTIGQTNDWSCVEQTISSLIRASCVPAATRTIMNAPAAAALRDSARQPL